jgi:hypothetical protein
VASDLPGGGFVKNSGGCAHRALERGGAVSGWGGREWLGTPSKGEGRGVGHG